MRLQTHITIPDFSTKINYRTSVLLMGSCFAANIGDNLQQRKFPVTINPFGVIYNPQSIAQSIARLRTGVPFSEKELICHDGLWTTFFHHSSFSHPDKKVFLQQANEALEKGQTALQQAAFIVISLGTSWAYKRPQEGIVVNNCHKIPAGQFERILLSVEEITTVLGDEIATAVSPTWIFTVSPIRHWKDGAHGNQLSKAGLLLAIEKLQQQFSNVCYFPAYELMMDELRDYRFYTEDMLHPSQQAIEYIWQRFSDVAFDDETKTIVHELEKIMAACRHRPLHPETTAYRQFQTQLTQTIQSFSNRYPFVRMD